MAEYTRMVYLLSNFTTDLKNMQIMICVQETTYHDAGVCITGFKVGRRAENGRP